MAGKNVHYYLIKVARISGWLLLPLMLLYSVTGLAILSQFGLNKLIEPNAAKLIHQDWSWPLIALFLVHSLATIYLALRRWGWIKTRTAK
jgi:cytochrome b subunit of formate dehydrogenase